MAYAVSHPPFIVEARVRLQTIPHKICDGRCGSDMSFLEQFRFPCKYNSTNSPHSSYYLLIYQKNIGRKSGKLQNKAALVRELL